MTVSPNSLDQWYFNAVLDLYHEGERHQGRNGLTHSEFGAALDIDLREGFPILTCKKMNFEASSGETLAFLRGARNAKEFRAHGCNFWDSNAGSDYWMANPNNYVRDGDFLGRIYGVQWREWPYLDQNGRSQSLDQMQALLKGLREDPYGRRHMVTAWNPGEFPQMALPPCHAFFQVYCHADGGLSIQMYQRSDNERLH